MPRIARPGRTADRSQLETSQLETSRYGDAAIIDRGSAMRRLLSQGRNWQADREPGNRFSKWLVRCLQKCAVQPKVYFGRNREITCQE